MRVQIEIKSIQPGAEKQHATNSSKQISQMEKTTKLVIMPAST